MYKNFFILILLPIISVLIFSLVYSIIKGDFLFIPVILYKGLFAFGLIYITLGVFYNLSIYKLSFGKEKGKSLEGNIDIPEKLLEKEEVLNRVYLFFFSGIIFLICSYISLKGFDAYVS
ncbi:MAG: hypothetical protein C0601_13105 [Candidatus Muiribacterium halophilum]|uniref:Uncharacterized protein n=1 Tax=Muiribacterium halophilum TaxID=2053465 RepID=A0A2N5Z9Q5_MUIH1|nr:MAG: hypothetical protein C0601_13105 [Candidatus Muirbacterium halophilum]